MWERNYRGLEARGDEWIDMSRGIRSEVTLDEDDVRVQQDMSELTIRSQWRHYKSLMMQD